MLVALRNHTAVIIPDGGAEADCIEWFLLFFRFADVFHTNAAALPWIRRGPDLKRKASTPFGIERPANERSH